MTKNGILRLYVTHASDHIASCERAHKSKYISRARVELELLAEIDKGWFPIEWKMAWYSAILTSSNFETFWLSHSHRLHLPDHCTTRFIPDPSLLEYDAPPSSSSSSDAGSPPQLTEDHGSSSPNSAYDNDYDNGPDVTPAMAELARQLGPTEEGSPSHASDETFSPGFAPSQSTPLDPNGLARQEGDDGVWGHPKKQKAVKKTLGEAGKVKKPRKERNTPAKPRAPKAAGTGAQKRGVDDGTVMDSSSPSKKARTNSDGTARKRKPTAKAAQVMAEAEGV